MKILFSLVAPLAFAFAASGQITAALTRSEGRAAIAVTNNESLSLNAIAIRLQWKLRGNWPSEALDLAKAHARFYLDSLIDSATPLTPHEVRILDGRALGFLQLADPRVTFTEPIAIAGIFADGSTTGDPSLLTLMLLRRSNMLLAAETAIDILSDAGKHNVPPGWLTGQFRRLSLSHFYLLPEQEVGRTVYESILAKLTNLPDAPLGSPFPPTSFVERETAALGEVRAALVDSRPNLEQKTGLR